LKRQQRERSRLNAVGAKQGAPIEGQTIDRVRLTETRELRMIRTVRVRKK
jgi:hypothetical protein